ncbi:PLC-like phosphodiesterase [Amylostereum chailletii]|nr:PLC-like phosphodiesterase [Amylostereum chailletii]
MTDRTQTWAKDLRELTDDHGVDTIINIRPPTDREIRLSPEVEQYLEEQGQSGEDLLKAPAVVPPEVDDSLPLTHYFISSSHNTYLLSRQIMGRSSALSYVHVLWRHARCVEMDVWSSSEGPIVTHGYTLSSSVPFHEVCEAVGTAVRPGDWPVFVSLECHVGAEGQVTLVDTMRQHWGEKLVSAAVVDPGTEVTPMDLMGRIVVMVEYYPAEVPPVGGSSSPSNSSTSSNSSDEHVKGPQLEVKVDKNPPTITEALAALGLYARSMKPSGDWLAEKLAHPGHILINISESGLSSLLPTHLNPLVKNSHHHLRRVYPRGTRIHSSNMHPPKFWRTGAQITALNWQKYDKGTQFNEAMFVGTPGWVVKPARLLPNAPESFPKERLTCEIIGLSSLPTSENDSSMSAYLRAQLHHSGKPLEWRSKTVKCKDLKQRGCADFMWNETFEFEYEVEDVTFIRIVIAENVAYGRDPKKAIFLARVEQLEEGLRFIRLLNTKGKDTGATLLVKVSFISVE